MRDISGIIVGSVSVSDKITPLGKFIRAEMETMRKGPFIKAGFPEKVFEKKHKKGSGSKRAPKLSVGEIAAVHEFGSIDGTIPERSFMRSTYEAQRQKWRRKANDLMVQIAQGKMTVDKALGIIGSMVKGDIQMTIGSNLPPPNKPETIKRKTRAGRIGDRTLIDTAQMRTSVSFTKHKDRSEKSSSGESGQPSGAHSWTA